MGQDIPRTIFVGDVHGCLTELEALLRKLGVAPGDRVVFVGDLVAKGPDSGGVVDLARELGAACVRGNHDEAVLRYVRAERTGEPLPKLKKTHFDALAQLSQASARWLEERPLFLHFAELSLLVVHAGLVPGKPAEEQQPQDLLNMRTLRKDGSASSRLDEGTLWAKAWRGPEHVVFGHDAITSLQQEPFATGLDTGCVYGRALTALVLPERKLVSVDARRAYQEIGP